MNEESSPTETSPAPAPGVPGATAASRLRAKAPWFALALAVLAIDLGTKWWVFYPHVVEPGFYEGMRVGQVMPGWGTVLVYNKGITFGMLEGTGVWLLATGTGVVIAALVWKLWHLAAGRRLEAFALSIVAGGAVGNLYDRTLRPVLEPDTNVGVRDFVDWYVPEHTALGQWLIETIGSCHWYVFNVADACIVTGVVLLAWCILREPAVATSAASAAGKARVS